mmetsp:Transcript_2717/g.4620  ORF Transcript_2717/g.4620 Transcript_2717/m.4620 type:complete len:102 (+) Transcript_2717:162-467(+)
MMHYMKRSGSEDVTAKFDTVIYFGFLSNLLFIFYQMYKSSITRTKKNKEFSCGSICLEMIVTVIWLVQFGMVIQYRFSHTGKVCSGDYAEEELYDLENNSL